MCQKHLAAAWLRPDPLGKLTEPPDSIACCKGLEEWEREKTGKRQEMRDRRGVGNMGRREGTP